LRTIRDIIVRAGEFAGSIFLSIRTGDMPPFRLT
jgi:hypothetical protein